MSFGVKDPCRCTFLFPPRQPEMFDTPETGLYHTTTRLEYEMQTRLNLVFVV